MFSRIFLMRNISKVAENKIIIINNSTSKRAIQQGNAEKIRICI